MQFPFPVIWLETEIELYLLIEISLNKVKLYRYFYWGATQWPWPFSKEKKKLFIIFTLQPRSQTSILTNFIYQYVRIFALGKKHNISMQLRGRTV